MEPAALNLWLLTKIEPTKWAHPPLGDEGGGFWAIGIIGKRVIWYDDIEDDFNVSTYEAFGEIGENWSIADSLRTVMRSLLFQLQLGEFETHGPSPNARILESWQKKHPK